mmetsp:Transcript_25300/g.50379  ORF Transcript_25300/g.50379 Transcript_25300/m.50379 type:complete len:634 (+) Transcript_25300:109-2010(+)
MLPSGSGSPKQRRFGVLAAILSISMSLVVLSPFAVFGLDVVDSSSVVKPCSDDDPYCVALDDGEAPPCGLWMGKSPIKEREEHSFGLGVFTGVNIPQGSSVDVSPLMIVPDWDDARLPPLREYVWLGQNLMHLSLGTESGIFLFYPGVASLAPCTSQNFNLALSDDRAELDETYEYLHRSADAAAGAVETTRSGMYRAARDIVAGEELTVECTDASFDGGAHALNRFHADDHAVTCLDDRLEVREPSSHEIRVGRGLFAKRALAAGEVVISSPVVPVHRDELDLAPGPNDKGIDFTNSQNFPMPKWQMLLNYCFGHPDSDLLFLPVGSLVSYFNHPPAGKTANVEVRWHEQLEGDEGVGTPEDSQRQRYHFPELFAMDGNTVANKQGMGLMIDYVATRPIAPDEEATVDYGPLWEAAWKQHVKQWELGRAHRAANYQSAAAFTESEKGETLRTIVEQINDPYPANIWTACTFSEQWADPEGDVESVTTSWYNPDQDDVNCMLPCVVLERHLHASFEDDEDRAAGEHFYYKIQLVDRADNVDVDFECTMLENLDYFVTDVPRSAISFIDAPYSTDRYLENAFRQEMGVPKGLYPATWMRKKLRGAKGMSKANPADGAEFRVREARKTLEERGKK